jgi:hypothetical protein
MHLRAIVSKIPKKITTAKKPDEETLIGAQQSAKEVAASPKNSGAIAQ